MSAKNLKIALERYASIIETEYKSKMAEQGLRASGTSINQVRAFVKEESPGILTIKAPSDTNTPAPLRYALFGRKPGGMPPVSTIRAWAERKGIPGLTNRKVRNIAFAIGKRGTIKRFGYGGAGSAISNLVIQSVQNRLMADITDAYVKDLRDILNARS